MGRGRLTEQGGEGASEEGSPWTSGERCPGRENGLCKGSEEGLSFVCLRSIWREPVWWGTVRWGGRGGNPAELLGTQSSRTVSAWSVWCSEKGPWPPANTQCMLVIA